MPFAGLSDPVPGAEGDVGAVLLVVVVPEVDDAVGSRVADESERPGRVVGGVGAVGDCVDSVEAVESREVVGETKNVAVPARSAHCAAV